MILTPITGHEAPLSVTLMYPQQLWLVPTGVGEPGSEPTGVCPQPCVAPRVWSGPLQFKVWAFLPFPLRPSTPPPQLRAQPQGQGATWGNHVSQGRPLGPPASFGWSPNSLLICPPARHLCPSPLPRLLHCPFPAALSPAFPRWCPCQPLPPLGSPRLLSLLLPITHPGGRDVVLGEFGAGTPRSPEAP